MSCNSLCQQLRGVWWWQWFFTCMEGWLTLVSPAQLLAQKVLVLKIWKTAKNGEKSALFAIYFYQIHHFWYVFGHVIKQFFMPLNLVPFTCVHDLQACLFELNKFGHFFSLDTPFFNRQANFWKLCRPPESGFWGFHGGIPVIWVLGRPLNHW